MADTGCLKDLQKRMSVEAMQQGPEGIKEADTSLSVLYNLCIDNGKCLSYIDLQPLLLQLIFKYHSTLIR